MKHSNVIRDSYEKEWYFDEYISEDYNASYVLPVKDAVKLFKSGLHHKRSKKIKQSEKFQ